MGWGDIFAQIATAIFGPIASGAVAQGLNMAFAPKAPSSRDVQRDLQMQAETMANASRPVRTPEQETADKLAIENTQARQATFKQLSDEYNTAQAAGPSPVWDPYEESNIRKEAMAEAAVRGMGESGQAQDWVSRRLDEARLRRSGEANRLYEQKLSSLRTQMLPYSNVEKPGGFEMTPVPQANPLPRDTQDTFSASPVDVTSALMPRKGDDEEKTKRKPWEEEGALSVYGNPR